LAKRVLAARIPIFTSDQEDNKALHHLGIPGLTRSSVGDYLEKLGGHRPKPIDERHDKKVLNDLTLEIENKSQKFVQGKFNF